MKTMLDLLIRLVEMRRCCEQVRSNSQLTEGEKSAAYCFTSLVRDCLPPTVLETYDRMEETELPLLGSAEVFSMAVILATYRKATPAGRKKLLAHFTPTTHCAVSNKPLFIADDRSGTDTPLAARPRLSMWSPGNFRRGIRPDSIRHKDPPTDKSDPA